MHENHNVLFGQGAYGLRVWEIWSVGNTIFIQANGQQYTETVPEGKAGRSLKEQVHLRVEARVRSKLDAGFKRTREEAQLTMTNQLNLPMPMLAKQQKDVKYRLANCYVQPKLDGHRCLITTDHDGRIVAYSRRGKIIDTIEHIIGDLVLPDGVVLDGELYSHGQSLQTIASWAKRAQPNSKLLKFHAYDLIATFDKSMPFADRFMMLEDVHGNSRNLELVHTFRVSSHEELEERFMEATAGEGYEGLILRPERGVYGIGKRTNDLIKVKRRMDAEFKCIDVIPTRDGWGNLVLELPNGRQFKSLAPWTIHEKICTLHEKGDYIGRYVTCEFAGYTDDGVPFHCAAIRWRTEV